MAKHVATVAWARGDAPFTDGRYSRAFEMRFDGGFALAGSAAPSVVPAPFSREDAADPEELLVASLAACHMLVFIDLARRAGFVVDAYEDAAEGVLGKNADGRLAVTRVTLKPEISWSGAKRPTPDELADLHHKSHDACFIANSFRGDVRVEGH